MATQAEIAVLRGTATQVKNESQVGGNTAGRVGGLFEGIVDALPSDEVIDGKISEAVADIQPIVIEGNVDNAPDQEDLTSVNQGGTDVLKFKDKTYSPALFSGLGRVYLRKNVVTPENLGYAINLLTAEMVSQPNTIYRIQYDYDLNGETITLPTGCVLEFDGGSIKNGTITGNDTDIVADSNKQIFEDITFGGSFIIEKVSVKWFGAKGDGASADTKPIQEAFDFVCDANVSKMCYIPNGVYLLPPAGAISEGSRYNYHLWLKDSITIIGEDKYNTILKRVLPDLSEPTKEAYAVKVETGAMIYYITTNTTDVNAVFSVQNLTLDGNENWYHYTFAYYRNTLISTVSGGNRLRNNVFKNLICKNTCDEGIHLEAIDWYTTSICENCDFYNIGGGGGNLAGGHTSYIACNFERTFIEFGWYSSVVPSDTDAYLKVERCTFKNRAGNLLSADYQGNMTGYSTARKYLFVNNCKFTNTDDFRAETDAITDGNVNIMGMRSIYFGNLEECHITNCKFVNGAYRTSRGGNVIFAKVNTYSDKVFIKNNYIFQTCDYTKINTEYVKFSDVRGNEFFATNGKDIGFLPNNNTGNIHSTNSLLTANANYVFTYYNKADVNMFAVVEIVNLSGAAANVTIRQRGVSSATRASVNKSFPTGISYEYFAFTTETSNSFLATTAASDVYFSVKIAEQNIVPSISGVNIANNYKGLIVNSVGVLSHYDGTKNVDAFGYPAVLRKGTTAQRPTLTSDDAGFQYYDTTIGETITWDGSAWETGGGDPNAVTKTSTDDINVWTDKSVVVGWFNADGSIGSGTSNITAFIPVMANGTYLLTSAFHSQGGREYDANKQLLRSATYSSSTKQFTIGENTAYIRFGFQTSATQAQIDAATLKSVGGYAMESDVRVLYLENLLSALADRVSALENA